MNFLVIRRSSIRRSLLQFLALAWVLILIPSARAADSDPGPETVEVKNASFTGSLDGDTARLVIQATLGGPTGTKEPALVGADIRHRVTVARDEVLHSVEVRATALRGTLREWVLGLNGAGEVTGVDGNGIESWSVRRSTNGMRSLVIRWGEGTQAVTRATARVRGRSALGQLPATVEILTFAPEPTALLQGYVRIDSGPEVATEVIEPAGLVPMEAAYLPEDLRSGYDVKESATAPARTIGAPESERTLAYRFQGAAYTLPLRVGLRDPEAGQVVITRFELQGELSEETARFGLSATARVRDPKGGRLDLLEGGIALVEPPDLGGGTLRFDGGRYVAVFDRAGEFPIRARFDAAVQATNEGRRVDFRVAAAALSPVTIRGLDEETRLDLGDASKPERRGGVFTGFLPASGRLNAWWRRARPDLEGRLFYAAELTGQVAVGPGLLRQAAWVDLKVMQGELTRLTLGLRGAGEVTRVQGPQVLAWSVEPVEGSTERRLSVQFNQPQRDRASLQIQMQQALGSFPLAIEPMQLVPEGATRLAGLLRVVNDGAVRLEVIESTGLSQISPDQFVGNEAVQASTPSQGSQVFAYRFAGSEVRLRVQADNILPELGVSQVLVYHLGESESVVEADWEIDVREAPMRELTIRVPKGFGLARLEAPGSSDHFLTELAGETEATLRLVYGTPVSGRQLVQIRLERNQPPGDARWVLPRLEVSRAKSVRGHVGVSADAGFRLTPGEANGLTEVATAFFPKRTAGLQLGFRVVDPGWSATIAVERLPQSIHADVLHLFSVGEGIAYGSSLIHYVVSGAPVSTLQVELSAEYFNVEFVGKNVRHWQKTDRGYQVQLHSPVAGSYALLATYERPFKAQGETLTFVGARPIDARSEQGYSVVISTYQFQVQPVNVSPTLVPLETAEVPPEYRLLFDAPILAAYRYTTRPFNLQLELRPLSQAEVVSQVVDRAALTTRISEEGQVVTEGRYFVKHKGATHLRVRLPEGAALWSATVDGAAAVPVKDGTEQLIPLPHRPDPNAVCEVRIKLASRSANAKRLTVAAPMVAAPVLLGEWTLEPAASRRLLYRGGTLTPVGGVVDGSGFAEIARLWRSEHRFRVVGGLLAAMVSLLIAGWAGSGLLGGGSRFGVRHWVSGCVGLGAAFLAIFIVLQLRQLAVSEAVMPGTGLHFVAPVQQGDTPWQVEVGNLPREAGGLPTFGTLLLSLLAFVIWVAAWASPTAALARIGTALGWTVLFWAALRLPGGASWFGWGVVGFVVCQVLLPAAVRWWQTPRRPSTIAGTTASVIGGLWVATMLVGGRSTEAADAASKSASPVPSVALESAVHEWAVSDDFVTGRAIVRWRAERGQALTLLNEGAVLLRSGHPADRARLVQLARDGRRVHLLVAETNGWLEFPIEYQTRVVTRGPERGFRIPVAPALVNQGRLNLSGMDVDVASPQAVRAEREGEAGDSTNTVVRLVLAPSVDTWVGWKPRSRDTRRERAVFFAECAQVFLPGPGAIEGVHEIQVRPAQGELEELTLSVPPGMTISDVSTSFGNWWRFDPDQRRLRVTLSPAQSKPFAMIIRSQTAATPLPFERSIGLLAVEGTAGQVGAVGVATGAEVQLDDVRTEGCSAINLEDFSASLLQSLKPSLPGLTLRRAYRYESSASTLVLKASPVEPDVRVESQQTLSLGEDRTVLAANLDVEIHRAGIFKWSFALPAGLDVESVAGAAMSHWTELRSEAGRMVTVHLKGRTEGRQRFTLTLTGSGVRAAAGWDVPRLAVRGATKQRGQLMIVPEQGLRLQVAGREGVTQLDPMQAGIREKGVLAFRLLQDAWSVRLDLERVDAWIQVTGLQHVTLADAQARVIANLQYEIENTGVKSLVVRLPAAAEGVRFRGDHVVDFVARPAADGAAAAFRDWEVKLERRVMGRYLLQASHTLTLPEQAAEVTIDGVEAREVNLQRGFVGVQAGGRLEVRVSPPPALQPTDWQVVPRNLQQDLEAPSANHAFRLVEPSFRLPVQLVRHEATRLLPARVAGVELTSVVSDDGATLTRVRLRLAPGDKRLLQVSMPERTRFWFAFVNQNGVWPWRSTNEVLIPLEQNARTGEEALVEFFYAGVAGKGGRRSLDLDLRGPRFDLPLENISWTVFLNEKWRLDDWDGSLQLQDGRVEIQPAVLDLDRYLSQEVQSRKAQTQEAAQALNVANRLLEEGDPQQARRAFQAAFGLSQHDQAFNEDARVQLNNLKIQQAMVGLNVRQARVGGAGAALSGAPRALRDDRTANYTQSEAKQLLERNSAEDTAAQTRLAERLVQQQEAAVSSPATIRAGLPEQGRKLIFTRPLEIDPRSELRLRLEAGAATTISFFGRVGILAGAFLVLATLLALVRRRSEPGADHGSPR